MKTERKHIFCLFGDGVYSDVFINQIRTIFTNTKQKNTVLFILFSPLFLSSKKEVMGREFECEEHFFRE
jgi:hypothetical protein